jgi:hypothetical protein
VAGEVPGGSTRRVSDFFATLEPPVEVPEPAAA